MANYYNDNPNLDFYLDHPLMKRIVELKERNFADKDTYADAPVCWTSPAILPPISSNLILRALTSKVRIWRTAA